MKNKCRSCGQEYEIEPPVVDGQQTVCPYCNAMDVYRKPARIEIPVGARREKPLDAVAHRVENQDAASTMQPVSRLHVIRPAAASSQNAGSTGENAMVERVRARARAESRRELFRKIKIVIKDLTIFLFLAIALYLLTAVMACLFLLPRIAEADARNFGVRVALAKLTRDARLIDERASAVRADVREKGLSRITETARILNDAELNRLAQTYQGVDWAERERAFLEQVTRSRDRLFLQKKREDDKRRVHDKNVRDLELQKEMLSHELESPYEDQDRANRKNAVEQKLAAINKREARTFSGNRQEAEDRHAAANAQNEAELIALAERQEDETYRALLRSISDQRDYLRKEADKPARLRRLLSAFDVWPVNRIFNIPRKSPDAERL